jgi:hypothetical protein
MHGSEFQLTNKKPCVPAETFLIFCFVRYPRVVVGKPADTRVQYKDSKRMPAPSERLGRGLLVLSGFLRICSAWLWLGRGMSRHDAR